MSTARPERGRFRTFLLTALRNFLTNEWHRAHAAKRGGSEGTLSIDFQAAESAFRHEPSDPAPTPEQAFDRTWALGMIDRTTDELRTEYERSGRGVLFAELTPFLWNEHPSEALTTPAGRMGMTRDAFTVALHRLRQRIGRRLRANVAKTVASNSDVDEELHQLIASIGGSALVR